VNRRVAAYARYSTSAQKVTSITDQIRNIRKLIEKEGDDLDEKFIFTDEAVSGTTEAGRDGLRQLKEAIFRRPAPVDALVVDDLSRLGRNMTESLLFQEDCDYFGIELITVDGLRSSNPAANLGFKLKSLIDDVYIQDLRHKTLRGLEGQVHRGFSAGGRTFGYRSIPVPDPAGRMDSAGNIIVLGKKPVIHEPEAEVVRRAYQLRLEGRSLSAIVEALATSNAPAPNPGKRAGRPRGWSVSSLQYLLKNRVYRGEVIYGRDKFMKNRQTGKRVARRRPESEWTVEPRPDLAIVPRDVFDRVQAMSAAKNGKLKRGSGGRYKGSEPGRCYSPYLLSGILKCGVCGSSMVIYGGKQNENNGKVYRGYQCPSRKRRGSSTCTNTLTISQGKIESAVVDEVKKKLLSPDNIAFYEAQFRKVFDKARKDSGADARAKEIERQIVDTRKAIKNLLSFLKTNGGSESVARELAEAEAKERELTAELASLASEGRTIFPPPGKAIRDGLLRLQGTLYADPVAARELLKTLIGELKLTPRLPPVDVAATGTDDTSAGASQKEESRTPCYEVSGSVFLPNLLIPLGSGGPSVVAGARNSENQRQRARGFWARSRWPSRHQRSSAIEQLAIWTHCLSPLCRASPHGGVRVGRSALRLRAHLHDARP
jgi:DNA invertase Pin-like site-specific DNA recombinase